MKARWLDLSSNFRKSVFWKRGGKSFLCLLVVVLPEDNMEVDSGHVASRHWIAWELVLTTACIVFMVSVGEAIMALRLSVLKSSMIVCRGVGGA